MTFPQVLIELGVDTAENDIADRVIDAQIALLLKVAAANNMTAVAFGEQGAVAAAAMVSRFTGHDYTPDELCPLLVEPEFEP